MLTAKISGIMPAEFTFSGNEGGVAAVLLVPTNSLGVVDRNPALALVDIDDADDGSERDEGEEDGSDQVVRGRSAGEQTSHRLRQTCDDAAEDDDRNAISDAVFGDELTHPDKEHRAGRHGQQQRRAGEERIPVEKPEIGEDRLAADAGAGKEECLTVALQKRKGNGQEVGVLVDLVAALLAFVRQFVQPGNHRRKQLHDDRGGDVGIDTQRHDREVAQTASGEEVEHAEELISLDIVRQSIAIDARNRNAGDDAEEHQNPQREENLPPEIRDLECLGYRLEHLGFLTAIRRW